MNRERISPNIASLQNRRSNLEKLKSKHENIRGKLSDQIGSMPLTDDLSALDQDMRLADTVDFANNSVEKFSTKIEVTTLAIEQKVQEGLAKLQGYVERGLISQEIYEKRVAEVQGLALISGSSTPQPQLTEGSSTPVAIEPITLDRPSSPEVAQTAEVSMERAFLNEMEQVLIETVADGVSEPDTHDKPESTEVTLSSDTTVSQEAVIKLEKDLRSKRIVITEGGNSKTHHFEPSRKTGEMSRSYELLKLLASKPDGGFIAKEITQHFFPDKKNNSHATTLINNARMRIEDNPGKPRIIVDHQVNLEEDPKAPFRWGKEYSIGEHVKLEFPDETQDEAKPQAGFTSIDTETKVGMPIIFGETKDHPSPEPEGKHISRKSRESQKKEPAVFDLGDGEIIEIEDNRAAKLAKTLLSHLDSGSAMQIEQLVQETFGKVTSTTKAYFGADLKQVRQIFDSHGIDVTNLTTPADRVKGIRRGYTVRRRQLTQEQNLESEVQSIAELTSLPDSQLIFDSSIEDQKKK